jgi:hypothetical protein
MRRVGISNLCAIGRIRHLRKFFACGGTACPFRFPGCEIKLTGGDPAQVLQRINQYTLDCAILPMPIDNDIYHVQQISQSPLVICMLSDDPLAQQPQSIFMRVQIESRSSVVPNSSHPRIPGWSTCSRRSGFPCMWRVLPVHLLTCGGW